MQIAYENRRPALEIKADDVKRVNPQPGDHFILEIPDDFEMSQEDINHTAEHMGKQLNGATVTVLAPGCRLYRADELRPDSHVTMTLLVATEVKRQLKQAFAEYRLQERLRAAPPLKMTPPVEHVTVHRDLLFGSARDSVGDILESATVKATHVDEHSFVIDGKVVSYEDYRATFGRPTEPPNAKRLACKLGDVEVILTADSKEAADEEIDLPGEVIQAIIDGADMTDLDPHPTPAEQGKVRIICGRCQLMSWVLPGANYCDCCEETMSKRS
jgi:hypothetical protein